MLSFMEKGGRNMNKRGTGTMFCLIAALLFCTKYTAAAIYLSQTSSWSNELFESGLQNMGNSITVINTVSLVIGLIYLIAGEYSEFKK